MFILCFNTQTNIIFHKIFIYLFYFKIKIILILQEIGN